jgi:ubiquinone/menaquinone biosynthesis C-methylase UbiE
MATALERLSYTAAQAARVAWFAGHYALTSRLSGPITPPGERAPQTRGGIPPVRALRRSLIRLFEADWRNIADGVYAAPTLDAPGPRALIRMSRRYFRDFRETDARRMRRGAREVKARAGDNRYPDYYLQNFHYQTDGWLSEHSARLYDFQVETLFAGAADAMRRQALPPIARWMKGRDPRTVSLLDVGSGTARFLTFVKDSYPRMDVAALDLSAPYLEVARRNLRPWPGVDFIEANAEAMPVDDASRDIVTATYLFHELPPQARARVAREIARVLKPGGLFVMVDSLQRGDVEGWDGLLELFPHAFHEPYYLDYIDANLDGMFGAAGLEALSCETAYLSRIAAYVKRG